MKKLFILIGLILAFGVCTNAQTLRAYNLNYTSEFGSPESCYLTLKTIVADWTEGRLTVFFNCYESKTIKERGTSAKQTIVMTLQGQDFVDAVSVPLKAGEAGKPRVFALSEWTWTIAQSYPFFPDYSYDDKTKTMVATRKSLTDLAAVKVDLPIQ